MGEVGDVDMRCSWQADFVLACWNSITRAPQGNCNSIGVPFGSAQQKQTQKKKQKKQKTFTKFPPLNPKEFDDHHDNKDDYDGWCIMGFVKFVKNTPYPIKVHLHNWFLEAPLQLLFPS